MRKHFVVVHWGRFANLEWNARIGLFNVEAYARFVIVGNETCQKLDARMHTAGKRERYGYCNRTCRCNHLPTSAYGGGVSAESHCGAGWGAGSTPLERVPGIPDIFLYSKDALVSYIYF